MAAEGGSIPRRQVVLPEIKALRELRHHLARGGLAARERRTPGDWARLATFNTIVELLRILREYQRRIEGGERCVMVTTARAEESGRVTVEIAIESAPR